MRGPRLFLFFTPKVGEDQKKVFMSVDVAFSLKTSVKTKKKVFVVCDETPHLLRGFRLQPGKPTPYVNPALIRIHSSHCINEHRYKQ